MGWSQEVVAFVVDTDLRGVLAFARSNTILSLSFLSLSLKRGTEASRQQEAIEQGKGF